MAQDILLTCQTCLDDEEDLMNITREELYAAVWKTPLNKLADEFRTGSHNLVKACEVMHVPRPRQGHWTRLSLGKAPEPTPLGALPEGAPARFELRERAPKAPSPPVEHPRKPPAKSEHHLCRAPDSTFAVFCAES
jgi:hypothetical protein